MLLELPVEAGTDAVDALEVLLQAFGPEEKEVVDFIEGVSLRESRKSFLICSDL